MLKVGFGQADITPPVGASQTGSFRPRVMNAVHDPLLAVAAVFDDGNTPLALVGIDVGLMMRETGDTARALIAQQTGIPRDHVIISASHTHQGGPTHDLFNAHSDPAYVATVTRGIAVAVADAWTHRAAGEIASAFGRVTGIHFNRRFLMRDGREVTHPGKLHPQIVRPAGPVDEKVGVLAARDSAGNITGIVVNFACHPTVTEDGTEYSGDYIHYLRQHLIRMFPGIKVAFLLGACGDVTQIDNQKPGWEKGHPWADTMGATLAAEVARTVSQRMTWQAEAALRAAGELVPTAIRAGDACEPATLGLGSGEEWDGIYKREAERVAQMRVKTPTVDCEVRAARIGDLAIVSSGGELFSQPALDIQQASPLAKTWVVTLANEYRGYIPTATAHHAGGYEVRTARSSYLEVDAAQKLVQASIRSLRAIAE